MKISGLGPSKSSRGVRHGAFLGEGKARTGQFRLRCGVPADLWKTLCQGQTVYDLRECRLSPVLASQSLVSDALAVFGTVR